MKQGYLKSSTLMLCFSINKPIRILPLTETSMFPGAGEVHPERAALLAEVQQISGLTWTPGVVERFAAEAPGSSKSYGVKGNVSEVRVPLRNLPCGDDWGCHIYVTEPIKND